jgi:hypothetical protein
MMQHRIKCALAELPSEQGVDNSQSAILPINMLSQQMNSTATATAHASSFVQAAPLFGDDCFAYFNPRTEASFHQIVDVWDSALMTMAEYFIK